MIFLKDTFMMLHLKYL
ncbi:hypothetical protein R3I94_022964 [Phoxinus phoxinus]